MRSLMLVVIGAALLPFNALPAGAKVNCNQVRLYIKTGRTVEQVAETMIIDVEQVKKCLAEAEGATGPTPSAGKRSE